MSRPLRSTPTPASRSFTSYYGPVRQRAPRSVLNASGFRRRHAPSRDLGGLRPRIAVSTLAFSRSVQEPQTRLTPPLRRAPPGQYIGHPPGSSRENSQTSRFRCHLDLLTTPQQRTPTPRHPRPGASGTSSWSPPDASSRAFSLSLTTTVFSQRSTGRFSACPRRPTLEGQQASISRTAPPMKDASYMTPPSAFVTHGPSENRSLVRRDFGDLPGMAREFVGCQRGQMLLMPPSLSEWLPEDHLGVDGARRGRRDGSDSFPGGVSVWGGGPRGV